jgi:molybdopterin synthase catalytic subunit
MTQRKLARITAKPIDPAKVLQSVQDPSAGGTVIFLGTIRNRSEGRAVTGLKYEVYKEMAEKRMVELEAEAKARWPVKRVTVVHRYGSLRIGEVSVAVAVSSEHRAEAFEACRFLIDSIKSTLPLWKKEKLRSGKEHWTRGQPISGA